MDTKKLKKLMDFMFLITLFFFPVEMAMKLNFGFLSPYKVSLLFLIILSFIYVIKEKSFKDFFCLLRLLGKKFKYPIIFTCSYIIFDLISLLWTKDKAFSLKKYITIGPALICLLYSFFYFYMHNKADGNIDEALKKLFFTGGIVALFLSVLTWIYVIFLGRTFYILRTSLQSDYNQYALSIYIGFFIGLFYILKYSTKYKLIKFFVFITLVGPIFYTSGSRRFLLAILPSFMIFIVFAILYVKRLNNNFNIKKFIIVLFLSLLTSFAIISLYNNHSNKIYEKLKNEFNSDDFISSMDVDTDDILHGFALEKSLSEKAETIKSGSALGQREKIWSIAIDEIKSYNIKDLILGKGGSHHRDIYRTDKARKLLFPENTPKEKFHDYHPHSFFFVDILDGGLIKLSISILLIVSIISIFVKLFLRNEYIMSGLILIYGANYLYSQSIDSINGIFENRLTYIFLIISYAGAFILDEKEKNY